VLEGPTVHVEAINVVGNTTLSEEALHEVLAPYIGRPLSTTEIHRAADDLMRAIRTAGAGAPADTDAGAGTAPVHLRRPEGGRLSI